MNFVKKSRNINFLSTLYFLFFNLPSNLLNSKFLFEVNDLVKKEQIDIAIIAVPADSAQGVADKLVVAGVKAILNFAPRSLKVPPDVTVKYENMAVEMEALSYFLSNKK